MIGAPLELVCPAGTPAALQAAVDSGADVVYVGFRDETNARNFPGLNFSRRELEAGIAYARAHGAKVYVAVNTFPAAGRLVPWHAAIDDAAALGADAAIIADIGLLDYAAAAHPGMRRHLSVQASAAHPAALEWYRQRFGIARAVLPRVLTVAEIAAIARAVPLELEAFAFGGLCPMAEGRCALSSYVTGESPNINGVCSPAGHVRYVEELDGLATKLGGLTIDRFAPGEPAGYPTLCKGRFVAHGAALHLFEDPTSLNVLEILPQLAEAGVRAIKIEGRQRGRAYVAAVVTGFRRAIDALACGEAPPELDLAALTEGGAQTTGAYRKDWR